MSQCLCAMESSQQSEGKFQGSVYKLLKYKVKNICFILMVPSAVSYKFISPFCILISSPYDRAVS